MQTQMQAPSQQMMQQPVLYYSRHCQYCARVLDLIARRGLQSTVSYVCVDGGHPRTLPPYVDRVPLMLASHGQLLAEDALQHYIEHVCGREPVHQDAARLQVAAQARAYQMQGVAAAMPSDAQHAPQMQQLRMATSGPVAPPPAAPVAAEFAGIGDSMSFVDGAAERQRQEDAMFGFFQVENMRPNDNFPTGAFHANSPLPPPAETACKRGMQQQQQHHPQASASMSSPGSGGGNMEDLLASRDQALSAWFPTRRAI